MGRVTTEARLRRTGTSGTDALFVLAPLYRGPIAKKVIGVIGSVLMERPESAKPQRIIPLCAVTFNRFCRYNTKEEEEEDRWIVLNEKLGVRGMVTLVLHSCEEQLSTTLLFKEYVARDESSPDPYAHRVHLVALNTLDKEPIFGDVQFGREASYYCGIRYQAMLRGDLPNTPGFRHEEHHDAVGACSSGKRKEREGEDARRYIRVTGRPYHWKRDGRVKLVVWKVDYASAEEYAFHQALSRYYVLTHKTK